MSLLKKFYTLLCYILIGFIKAQDHGFFNQVWLEEGLSQSSISSIVQDSKGLIWFGTQDGLNRYDGRLIDHYNFKPFDSKTISGDDITAFCTMDNSLYIISAGGLDKMDLNTQAVTHYKEEINENEKPATLIKIWNVNNTIFLFTSKGFTKLDIQNGSFKITPYNFNETVKSELRTFVFSICNDANNNLYAATNKGIFILQKNNSTLSPLFDINNLVKTEINIGIECNAILNYNEKLFFTIANNFYSYNLNSATTTSLSLSKISPSVIKNCIIDNQGHPWLGTNGAGLFRLSSVNSDTLYIDKSFNKSSNERFGLKSNDITSIYQNLNSTDGIVWIGTRDAGAFNYSYSKNSFDLASSILNNNEPNYFGVVKDKDGIIWSGFNNGILKLDRKNKSFAYINLSAQLSKLQRFIEAIYCDENNEVWVGFSNSLYIIDKKNPGLKTIIEQIYPGKRNHVVKIAKYNQDELALCCSQGMAIYNLSTKSIKYINEIKINGEIRKIENSNSFFIDSKNNWWIGSAKGLFLLNPETGKGEFFTHLINDTNSLVSSRIMDINETKDGNIIVATTKGLSILKDLTGRIKFENYHNVKGLSNNFIYGLLRDEKGNFWMTTNFGISIFNPTSHEFKSYSASDGVCINEFNSAGFHKSFDGELLFGGIGGLVSIYPEKQIINKNVPDIFLKSLKIENYNDTTLTGKKTFYLSHDQNKINFEFTVPDFSGVNNINLFYRFVPNTNWTKINPSQIFSLYFAKLAPGTYNLEIIAVNSENVQSKPLEFAFIISPPFWNTWWFFVFIIVGIIIITWIVYRIRLHNKIEHIKELEFIRKEENEKVRKAAALDLHDEFGNGLTRISMLIEMARIHTPKENTEANTILDVISQNSQRLYQGTKDFIWSINPGNDNLYEITIRIKDFGDELFYGTGCTFKVNGLISDYKNYKQLPSSGRNIAMIFKEALSNIIKHSKATQVELNISMEDENIILTLVDNGVGFESKEFKNSFGLSNMNQRASRVGAKINVQSELNKGTKITLVINKSKNTLADEK